MVKKFAKVYHTRFMQCSSVEAIVSQMQEELAQARRDYQAGFNSRANGNVISLEEYLAKTQAVTKAGFAAIRKVAVVMGAAVPAFDNIPLTADDLLN